MSTKVSKKRKRRVKKVDKSSTVSKAKRADTHEESFIAKLKRFFRGVVEEYKRITWPSYKDVIQASVVVIVIMIGISAYMYVVDILSAKVIEYLQRLFGG